MADGDEGKYPCPYCSKSYQSEGWLDNHIEDKHPDEADSPDEEPVEVVEEEEADSAGEPDEAPCDNHPDRTAVWESDGVTANVVRYCEQCKERYT